MNWSYNPPSRLVQSILFSITVAVCAATPLINTGRDIPKNKDYTLWYEVGVQFNTGAPLYPTDGRIFPFMYPPFAGFLLGLLAHFGETASVVILVCVNTAVVFAAIELSVRMVAGTPVVSLWLRTIPIAICIFFMADMFTLGQPNLGLLVLLLGGLMLLRPRAGSVSDGAPAATVAHASGSSKSRWLSAGVCFALATAIKAFPAAILAYLIWRREWKAALTMIAVTVCLLVVVPSPQRGFERNFTELKIWADGMLFQNGEKGIGQRPEQSIGWRNQSLTGVGHRFLRPADAEADAFNAAVEPQYVNVLNLDYRQAQFAVLAISALLGVGFILVMPPKAKRSRATDSLEYGLLFVLMTIGTPYAFSYYFIWFLFPLTVCIHRMLTHPRAEQRWLGGATSVLVAILFATGIPAAVTDDHTTMALGNLFWSAIVLLIGLSAMMVNERRATSTPH